MPSTGMPSAIFSSSAERLGNSCSISRARCRTGAVSRSSRLGGERHALRWVRAATAGRPPRRRGSVRPRRRRTRRATGDRRWAGTRRGCHRAPRTRLDGRPCRPGHMRGRRAAPRSPTRSCPRPPATSSIGARPTRLSASGCSAARTDATTTSGCVAPDFDHSCMRRRACSRRPTVSALGESRSCGSVSHAGNSSTSAPSR